MVHKKSEYQKRRDILNKYLPGLSPFLEQKLLTNSFKSHKKFADDQHMNKFNVKLHISHTELFYRLLHLLKENAKSDFSDKQFCYFFKSMVKALELVVNQRGENLLHYSLTTKEYEIARFLIEMNFNAYGINLIQENALHTALKNKIDNFIISLLIKNSPYLLFDTNAYGETPYELSFKVSDFDTIKTIITSFATALNLEIQESGLINYMFASKRYPIHYACEKGNEDLALFLINNNADALKQDDFLRIPLHYACEIGNVKLIEQLLRTSPTREDIYYTDKASQTPIEIALIKVRDKRICSILDVFMSLRKRKMTNYWDNYIGSLIHLCTVYQNELALNHLLSNYLKNFKRYLNYPNTSYETPLIIAIKNNNYNLAKILLDHDSNLTSSYMLSESLLHMAARNNNFDLVKLLIEKGHKINVTDRRGRKVQEVTKSIEIKNFIDFLTKNFQEDFE
ncbi:MAG: ankyrin repeat domain-containing protein [Candidatus Micrarchaeota archaeon]|nr:ankyrin repeat domain-containing protein [Candidatus Micrarchaeota archaeon]